MPEVGDGPATEAGGGEVAASAATHPLAREVLFNPSEWSIWPAVAVLRWMLRTRRESSIVYRSHPSLTFAASEIKDVAFNANGVELTLSAPGLAAPGTILPTSDIARIVADARAPGGGALALWLDGPGDLFMQLVETSRARHSDAFALATGAAAQSVAVDGRPRGLHGPARGHRSRHSGDSA